MQQGVKEVRLGRISVLTKYDLVATRGGSMHNSFVAYIGYTVWQNITLEDQFLQDVEIRSSRV